MKDEELQVTECVAFYLEYPYIYVVQSIVHAIRKLYVSTEDGCSREANLRSADKTVMVFITTCQI